MKHRSERWGGRHVKDIANEEWLGSREPVCQVRIGEVGSSLGKSPWPEGLGDHSVITIYMDLP